MQKAVESGRQAYLAGRMKKTPLTSASSPQKGLME
jgi:thiazole synthase ThiGH ThiG subunit